MKKERNIMALNKTEETMEDTEWRGFKWIM